MKTSGGYGGLNHSTAPANRIIVRRTAAIGDSLCATIVADKLATLGFDVVWQTHPDIQCVIRRHPTIMEVRDCSAPTQVDLDGAYEKNPLRRAQHFHRMFIERANEQLARFGIGLGPALNCLPRIHVSSVEIQNSRNLFKTHSRPWVFVCPRSDSYACRQIPDGIWSEAAKRIDGTKFWIGRHPAPAGFVDLQCRHFDNLIVWLAAADLLISVDTGPMHVAAAMGVPVLAIAQSSSPELHLSDQCDFHSIDVPGLNCLNCQKNLCPINQHMPPCQNMPPELIAQWANAKLSGMHTETVSAVVAVWKPKAEVLNHCLTDLLPQVHEIVVASERMSEIPPGAMTHPKIRYCSTWKQNIGYSGNANHGARKTVGKWLLFVNDDCFLKPDAVKAMMDCVKPDTGIVSNLLRYPDGTIYHAGKVRSPGVKGWGHINHRQHSPTFQGVTELENCCGCCVLVRRKAFFEVGGYDEEMPIFGQDDAFALSVRRAGWKILFTPHSEGVHMEHQSVNKIGNIMDLVGSANATFHRKWGLYLEHNLQRVPGNFDY